MVMIKAVTPVFVGLSGLATGEVFKWGPAADVHTVKFQVIGEPD